MVRWYSLMFASEPSDVNSFLPLRLCVFALRFRFLRRSHERHEGIAGFETPSNIEFQRAGAAELERFQLERSMQHREPYRNPAGRRGLLDAAPCVAGRPEHARGLLGGCKAHPALDRRIAEA